MSKLVQKTINEFDLHNSRNQHSVRLQGNFSTDHQMKTVFSEQAPKAIGPYSQAIRTGNLLYCSGQTPINPLTMKIEASDIAGQTQRAIENLKMVLEAAGLTLSNVVKTNVFLADMAMFEGMNKEYAFMFGDHRPARTTVAVKGLPYNALVEMECIAEFN